MELLWVLMMFECILFFIALFLNEKDIVAPPVMMTIMFIFSTSFTISAAKEWNVDFGFNSLFILVSGILVFIIAGYFYKSVRYGYKLKFNSKSYVSQKCTKMKSIETNSAILLFSIFFSIFCLIWYASEIKRITGYSGSVFGNVAGIYRAMTVHNTVSNQEFEGVNAVLSQLLKIVDVLGYVCGYILVFNINCDKKKIKTQISLLIIVIISYIPYFMTANRGTILQKTAAILVYIYVVRNKKYSWKKDLSFKVIRIGLVLVVIGIPAFYYSLNLIGRSVNVAIMQYTAKYVGSSIYLFDLFTKNPGKPPIVFGEESLIGVHSLLYRLGIDTYVRDVNLEKRAIISSNVYTFFRRPLHDFGLFGMYIFTFIIGYFFSWLYNGKVKRKSNNDFWVIILGYFYYWIILSSIEQNSFSYISINTLIKVVLIYFVMKIMQNKFRVKIKFRKAYENEK